MFTPRSAFARAVNRVLRDGQFTAVELAEAGGVSDRLIGYVCSGERDLPVSAAEKISRYLCDHGETRPALAVLCPRYTVVERAAGTANGSVKDEVVAVVRAIAEADAAHGQLDAAALRNACDHLREALHDLEAEADALAARQ